MKGLTRGLTRSLMLLLLSATSLAADFSPTILTYGTKEEAGQAVATEIAQLVNARAEHGKACVLGLATGSTPLPVYAELRRLYHAGELDLSTTRSFNLDEYVGIDRAHPESYHRFMWDELFEGLLWSPATPRGIHAEQIHLPPANLQETSQLQDHELLQVQQQFPQREFGADLSKHELNWLLTQRAGRYEAALHREGPADIQILGIGENGHIAFCEPGSPRSGRTSIVELTQNTREVNARFFDHDMQRVPSHAMSMGLASILSAKRIILIATGERKRAAVQKALHGPISEQLPASLLRLHPNVCFVLDQAANPGG